MKIIISTTNVADYPSGGGHFWVFMQYVLGLRSLGCEVYWLENFHGSNDSREDAIKLQHFAGQLDRFAMREFLIIHSPGSQRLFCTCPDIAAASGKAAEELCRQADLLINFNYNLDLAVLALFRKTLLIDIDPGLLQFWLSEGQIRLSPHNYYFSTGETIGRDSGLIPDCNLQWHTTRPVVYLEAWPMMKSIKSRTLRTISGWWGGGEEGEWVSDGKSICYENNKRVSFLSFAHLPELTSQKLELALCMGDGDTGRQRSSSNARHHEQREASSKLTDYISDEHDRAYLEKNGWRIRSAADVAATPEQYREYIQNSYGEFSCAKPSCMAFQNAWVSDRSLCFLASGRPVIVQYTGASEILPDAQGMFRFRTTEDALSAIDKLNADYSQHSAAARELAETCFDARRVLPDLINV